MAKLNRRTKNIDNVTKLFQVVIKTNEESDGPDLTVWTTAKNLSEACKKVEANYKEKIVIYNANYVASSVLVPGEAELLLL